jgi:hypothetical protein
MPESTELRFAPTDATITRTLRFATLVAPRQHESAREALMLRAATQSMLPPLQADEESATLRDRASVIGQQTLRLLNILLVDSSVYERARRPPRFHKYYNVHGRYAFTIIHMSA